MTLELERQHAHELLDRVPPEKVAQARLLLEDLVDDDDDELTPEDIAAIELSRSQFARGETFTMEEVLADFGLTMAEFEAMPDESHLFAES